MATKETNPVEAAWNKTKAEGNPDFAGVSPDFRARLQSVYGAALAGQPESGIAGLEEFEREIRANVKNPEATAVGQPGAPTLRDPAAVALGEQQAETTPKGTGAQDAEGKAEKDAAAVGQTVEHDEVHSPSAPSAARPLAAEAPGSGANPLPEDVGDGEGEAAGDDSDSSASAAKKGRLPEDFPGRAALEEAGITSFGKLRAVKDLTELPGIGDATAKKIEEALGEKE